MILRLAGYLFLCIAVAALAFDGTRMIADQGHFAFTSLERHWLTLSPGSFAAAKAAVEQVNSYLWSPLIMAVLVLPAWMVAGGIGTLLYLAGYRPPRPDLPDAI
ncbi:MULTISPECIES: hypothetical protein [Rhodomicrobium]|uniref:hypothetical protein n=1 Tax=Rhodomicrobium TaxID=1068 RepID=UPI000B4BBDD9|nr:MULTISPECIES: hypothetical protein [Rhodomicrobium]